MKAPTPDAEVVLTVDERNRLLGPVFAYAHPRDTDDPRPEWDQVETAVARIVADRLAQAQAPTAAPEACHETVTRAGQSEPCDRRAVAYRRDPEEGNPYPVCTRHVRDPALMVGLGSPLNLGTHVKVDPTVPPGTSRIIGGNGSEVTIVNIGTTDAPTPQADPAAAFERICLEVWSPQGDATQWEQACADARTVRAALADAAARLAAVEALVRSPQAEQHRYEACRGIVELPYASNRYVRLLDDVRAALSPQVR